MRSPLSLSPTNSSGKWETGPECQFSHLALTYWLFLLWLPSKFLTFPWETWQLHILRGSVHQSFLPSTGVASLHSNIPSQSGRVIYWKAFITLQCRHHVVEIIIIIMMITMSLLIKHNINLGGWRGWILVLLCYQCKHSHQCMILNVCLLHRILID